MAQKSGAEILTGTTVRKIESSNGNHTVTTVSSSGIQTFAAPVVILATGCRESTRHARLVPGKRPLGIFNTGALQQLVHLKHIIPGSRAIVLGSEHVSFSAVMTLKDAGVEVVGMIEPDAYPHSFSLVSWLSQRWYHFPLFLNSNIVGINGNSRMTSVTLEDDLTHHRREIPCDTLIVSGGFTPEISLALDSDLLIDSATEGLLTDSFLHTERKGIFGCGNILHGAETGDIAALEGRWAGANAIRYLDHQMIVTNKVRINCEPRIAWISPGNVLVPFVDVPGFLYTMRVRERVRKANVCASLNGEVIWKKAYGTLTPSRRIPVPVQDWKLSAGITGRDVIDLSIE
jgi:thioredoxin reductase